MDNLFSACLRMSLDTSGKYTSLTAEADNSEQFDICVGMDEPMNNFELTLVTQTAVCRQPATTAFPSSSSTLGLSLPITVQTKLHKMSWWQQQPGLTICTAHRKALYGQSEMECSWGKARVTVMAHMHCKPKAPRSIQAAHAHPHTHLSWERES